MFKDTNDWYKQRHYLHFDRPINLKNACSIVKNPDVVASHSFYPLINYVVESKKIRKDKLTDKIIVKKKQRPIAYASHVDSHIYSFYAKYLSEKYEQKLTTLGLNDCILAFRSLGKSNIHFALDAFNKIKDVGPCSAVALDLSKFFDTLDHQILKEKWADLINNSKLPPDHFNIFKSVTNFSQVEKEALYKRLCISLNNPKNGRHRICEPLEFRNTVRKEKLIVTNNNSFGIPQGSPLSALLSNIYMIDFDKEMKTYVDIHGGFYYRYCDDMLFIVPTPLRDKVAGFARQEIEKLKVNINPDKTELRTFNSFNNKLIADHPLQYLGFIFDGNDIYLRSSSLARYSEKMKRGVRIAKLTMHRFNKVRQNKGVPEKSLFMRKLYSRYTHLGRRNFLTYGYKAAHIMESQTIKNQLKPLWSRFKEEIKK